MKRAKKIYDQAFRDKAVQLALSSSKPFSETAEALGIKATTLYQCSVGIKLMPKSLNFLRQMCMPNLSD